MSNVKLKSGIIIGFSAIAVLFLTGCVPVPTLVNSSPRSVVVKNLNHPSEGQSIANQECARYGRYAIHRPDNIRDGHATYECVE